MSVSFAQIQEEFFSSLENIENSTSDGKLSDGNLLHKKLDLMDNLRWEEWAYRPDQVLLDRLNDYILWCEKKRKEDGGELMEEIAALAFRCLKGWEEIESYQSYSAQHDLVVSGSKLSWFCLMKFLHLPESGRTIVVEAKNLSRKVEDNQFSRLCGTIQNKFSKSCHLGIFFTRLGATGFTSIRSLRDSRATQILFHALTGKFVVVLDHQDLLRLKENGGLLKVLEEKIRDVEAGAKLSEHDGDCSPIKHPKHLQQYFV